MCKCTCGYVRPIHWPLFVLGRNTIQKEANVLVYGNVLVARYVCNFICKCRPLCKFKSCKCKCVVFSKIDLKSNYISYPRGVKY